MFLVAIREIHSSHRNLPIFNFFNYNDACPCGGKEGRELTRTEIKNLQVVRPDALTSLPYTTDVLKMINTNPTSTSRARQILHGRGPIDNFSDYLSSDCDSDEDEGAVPEEY